VCSSDLEKNRSVGNEDGRGLEMDRYASSSNPNRSLMSFGCS